MKCNKLKISKSLKDLKYIEDPKMKIEWEESLNKLKGSL